MSVHICFNLFFFLTEIKNILPNELKTNDWDVLIAHFLGVDHCGHKHGPMHNEMSRKLKEMNAVIEDVVEKMDNDTTLFVIGDHGMTGTGDHGGDTEDEVNALLFSHHKRHKFHVEELNSVHKEMRQIDLVPTLSIILGIPIPFSNLGSINFNLVPDIFMEHISLSQYYLLMSWQNVRQVHNYLSNVTYDAFGMFDAETMEDNLLKFVILSYRVQSLYKTEAQLNCYKDLKLYLRDVLKLCNDVWVKFDPSQMWQGLLIVSCSVFFIYLLIGNVAYLYFYRLFTPEIMMFIYGMNAVIIVIAYFFYFEMSFGSWEQGSIVLTSIFNIGYLSVQTVHNWPFITDNLEKKGKLIYLGERALLTFSVCVFFSNSFIVQEQKILCYILMGLLCLFLYNIQKMNMRFELRTK